MSRLTRIRVRGMRCLEDVTLELGPQCTVLVGANAVGKSALLDALALVSDLLLHGGGCLLGERRGALAASPTWFGRSVRFDDLVTSWRSPRQTEIDLDGEVGGVPFAYRIVVLPSGDTVRIGEEVLNLDGREVASRDGDSARIVQGSLPRARPIPVGVSAAQSVVALAADAVQFPAVHPVYEVLAGSCLLSPVPMAMRWPDAPQTPDDRPDRYGRDLARRLHHLLTEKRASVDQLLADQEYLGWSDLKAPVRNGWIDTRFVEREGTSIALSQASDGSLLTAWWASLVEAPPSGVRLYLLDEPLAWTFQAARQSATEILEALSAHAPVVLTTHHAEVVDGLGTLDNTWITRRRPGSGTTLVRAAADPTVVEHTPALGLGQAALSASLRMFSSADR